MFISTGLFNIVFVLIFVVVICSIAGNIIGGARQWNDNNHSPRLTVEATVVSKRMNVSHHNHPNAGDASGAHGYHSTSSTVYYVTFQVASGDRMELSVHGSDYGFLVEGDFGNLTFQGTRYLGFERR